MSAATKQQQATPATNGTDPVDPLAVAMRSEQEIAEEAAAIRDGVTELTAQLFDRLWPLLKRPIPAGFIETLPPGPGKPYESTGVRSVQVQIDRMNNVLGPRSWNYRDEYEQDGKLAKVVIVVYLGDDQEIRRSARGGVNQGSTLGNIYKGSFTNAAKLAFARLGPGHEVYLGAADLDPDTDAAAAEQTPAASPQVSEAGRKLAKGVVDRAWDLGVQEHLQLAASREVGADVGDCSTKVHAVDALKKMPIDALERLSERLAKKAKQAEGKEVGGE